MANPNPYEKLRRAFDQVYDRFPYFASICMRWTVVWTPKVPYAATNGPELFLNPAFVEQLRITEVVDLVLHELSHVFLGHMLRFPELIGKSARKISPVEHRDFNVAADAAANHTLLGQYTHLPEDHIAVEKRSQIVDIAIFPGRRHQKAGDTYLPWPQNKDAEFYLDLARKARQAQEEKQQAQPGDGKPQKQRGMGKPDGDPDRQEGDDGEATEDNQESEDSQNSEGDAAGDGSEGENAGSGSQDGDEQESGNEEEAGSQSGQNDGSSYDKIFESFYGADPSSDASNADSFGDILPHPSYMDEADENDPEAKEALKEKQQEAKKDWKKAVAQGINNAKMQGNMPGWLEELAKQIGGTKSQQNWKGILRRFMTRVVNTGNESYERPNKRMAWREDLIFPVKRSRQASKGCIMVDTSGSMNTNQCDQALREIEAILRTFPRCEIDMVMADTRLIDRSKRTFKHYDFPLRVPTEWMGRGGTDLCDPILGVADDRTYKWLVVISDMEWSADEAENPKIPTIFVWTPQPHRAEKPYRTPKFGTLIGPVMAK